MLTFDIETEALDDATIARHCPKYEPPEHPGEFDPSSVKLGTMKDQSKIDAKINAAREAHETAVANHEEICEVGAIEHFEAFKDKAALDASTGRVLVIGLYNTDNNKTVILDATKTLQEETALVRFWSQYQAARSASISMVGVNINEFDLPFLIRRSWILGVGVPATVRTGRWWDETFIDLCDRYYLGQRFNKPSASFDSMAKYFETDGKPDNGVSGKDFAKHWRENRKAAEEYLVSDLMQPAAWASRMGIV